MKGDVFDLNRPFKRRGCKTLLLLDNNSPHSVEDYEDQLTNITGKGHELLCNRT